MSENNFPKLHNAMWPGLVGKGNEKGEEPPISLERMLALTAAAEVDGQKFEGIDGPILEHSQGVLYNLSKKLVPIIQFLCWTK